MENKVHMFVGFFGWFVLFCLGLSETCSLGSPGATCKWSKVSRKSKKGGRSAAGGMGQRAQQPPRYRHPAALVACHKCPRAALPAQPISVINPTPTLKERVLIGFSPRCYQYVYFCQ